MHANRYMYYDFHAVSSNSACLDLERIYTLLLFLFLCLVYIYIYVYILFEYSFLYFREMHVYMCDNFKDHYDTIFITVFLYIIISHR